jgi:small subunit ribosomal protein S8
MPYLFPRACVSRRITGNKKIIMVIDPIADMLTRIRNAQLIQKHSTTIPYSRLTFEVARVLKECGYVENISKRGRGTHRVFDIALLYGTNGTGRIQGLSRVSKQSRRVYAHAHDLRASRKSRHGTFIVSTSRGVMSSDDARVARVGGEVLCEIW